MKNFAKKSLMYKYRFPIIFGILGFMAVILAAWDFAGMPNGLTNSEMLSAKSAGSLNLAKIFNGETNFANLPYLLLQHFSIQLFGYSTFAFRLPSVLLMIGAVVCLGFAMSRYQKKNMTAMAGFLVIGSPMFMSLARLGSSEAISVFLLSALLMMVGFLLCDNSKGVKAGFLKVSMCVCAALLVYSPGGIIVVAGMVLIGIFHPKTRYEIFRNKWYKILGGSILAMIIVSPILAEAFHGHFDWNLFGFANWHVGNFGSAFSLLFTVNGGVIGNILSPAMSISVAALSIFGIVRLALVVSSARARFVLPLFALSILFTLGDPSLGFWIFVPLSFALAVGVDGLVGYWYKLFPLNPYARVFAVPLVVVLVLSAGLASSGSFFASNFYNQRTVATFDREFGAIREVLSDKKSYILVVNSDQKSFYENLSRDFSRVKITDKIPGKYNKGELIISGSFLENQAKNNNKNVPDSANVSRITSDFTKDGKILVYKY